MLIMIYGDDALRVKERVLDMRQKFVEKFDTAQMNVDEFAFKDLRDHELGTVAGAIQASPFLATKRLVLIRGLAAVLKKTESQAWLEALSHIPESTIVILTEVIDSPAFEKTLIYKNLKDSAETHAYPLPQLAGGDLKTWARGRAKTHGAILNEMLLDRFLLRTGADSWRIDAELQKLAAFANGQPVTEKMLTLLVRAEPGQDIFAFLDNLSAKQSARAMAKLTEERAAGTDEFQLFGMLTRQIRLLLQVSKVIKDDPGVDKKVVAERLGLHPFVAQKLLTEVGTWSETKLTALHSLAFKLDSSMKVGLAPDVAVDRLVSQFLINTK